MSLLEGETVSNYCSTDHDNEQVKMKMLKYLIPLLLVSVTCTSAFSLSSLFHREEAADEVEAIDEEDIVEDVDEENEEEEEEEEEEDEELEDELEALEEEEEEGLC